MKKVFAVLLFLGSLSLATPAQAAAPWCHVGASATYYRQEGADIIVRYMGSLSSCTKATPANVYTLNLKEYANDAVAVDTTVTKACATAYRYACGTSIIHYTRLVGVCPDSDTPLSVPIKAVATGEWAGSTVTVETPVVTITCAEPGGGD